MSDQQRLKGLLYVPRVMISDKLASYGAAKWAVLPIVEHRRHKGLNNQAENSHQPTRERERRMRRFKSPGHAQRFLAASGPIAVHFRMCGSCRCRLATPSEPSRSTPTRWASTYRPAGRRPPPDRALARSVALC